MKSFLQCTTGDALLQQWDTGPEATLSELYGRGLNPFDTSAESVFSVVFTDGSPSSASEAYKELTSSAFSSCWASQWQADTTAPTTVTYVTPLHIEPLSAPKVAGAVVGAFSIDAMVSALGVTLSDSAGVTIVDVGAVVTMLVTVSSGETFPTSLRDALVAAIAHRMGAKGQSTTTTTTASATSAQFCRRSGIPDPNTPVLTDAQVEGIVHAPARFTGETTNGYSICVWSATVYSRITNGSKPARLGATWQVLIDGPLPSNEAVDQAYDRFGASALFKVTIPNLGDAAKLIPGTKLSPAPHLVVQAGAYCLQFSSATAADSPTVSAILQGLATAVLIRLKFVPAHSSSTVGRKRWSTDWAGPSFCKSHYDQPVLATFRGVASCGQRFVNTTSNTQGRICYLGCSAKGIVFDTVGFQCVEYAERYFYFLTGLRTLPFDPGSDIAEAIYYKFRAKNPALGLVPEEVYGGTRGYKVSLVKGDVISMWKPGVDTVGHVGVVTRVSVKKNSRGKYNGQITMINENAQGGITKVTVATSVLTYGHGYFTTFQWLTGLPTS